MSAVASTAAAHGGPTAAPPQPLPSLAKPTISWKNIFTGGDIKDFLIRSV
jgi:hypothetical protein